MATKDDAKDEIPPEPPVELLSEQGETDFSALIGTFQRVQRERDAKKAISEITAAFGKLSDEDLKLVLADDAAQNIINRLAAEQSSGLNPGDPIYDEKGREIMRVPFDEQWTKTHMPEVEWTVPQPLNGPRVWESVSWNGVPCPISLVAGTIVRTVCAYRDIVLEAANQQRNAYEMQDRVLKFGPSAAGEGFSVGSGWEKLTPQQLVASGGWVDR